MTPEEVPAELVEKAAQAIHKARCLPDCRVEKLHVQENQARYALAAVLPEIQAQALQELLSEFATWHVYDTRDIGGAFLADNVIEEVSERVARLTATTETAESPYRTCTGCRAQTLGECLCAEETEGATT